MRKEERKERRGSGGRIVRNGCDAEILTETNRSVGEAAVSLKTKKEDGRFGE